LSDGLSFQIQPEKTRWNWSCVLRTSSWTKMPVSLCSSQGAVVSQARRRTITSSTRTAWPGRSVRLREMPLRLLRRPITATRSAMGVVPGASSVTVCGMSTTSGSGSPPFCLASRSGAPPGPQAVTAARAAAAAMTRLRRIAQSGVQAS
jgi:hypothetical protein